MRIQLSMAILTLGATIHAWAAEPESLTYVYMPGFITTAAPLDEKQLMNMGCTYRTENPDEILRLRKILKLATKEVEISAPSINYRNALLFKKGDVEEKYLIAMRKNSPSDYIAKKQYSSGEIGIKIDSTLIDSELKKTDIEMYHYISGPDIQSCTSFSDFYK